MATSIKTLGQLSFDGSVASGTLYTVPAAASAIISTLVANNRIPTAGEFGISVAVSGASFDPKHMLYTRLAISGNDSFAATIGITLAATDKVWCWGTSGMSFSAFGQENT